MARRHTPACRSGPAAACMLRARPRARTIGVGDDAVPGAALRARRRSRAGVRAMPRRAGDAATRDLAPAEAATPIPARPGRGADAGRAGGRAIGAVGGPGRRPCAALGELEAANARVRGLPAGSPLTSRSAARCLMPRHAELSVEAGRIRPAVRWALRGLRTLDGRGGSRGRCGTGAADGHARDAAAAPGAQRPRRSRCAAPPSPTRRRLERIGPWHTPATCWTGRSSSRAGPREAGSLRPGAGDLPRGSATWSGRRPCSTTPAGSRTATGAGRTR